MPAQEKPSQLRQHDNEPRSYPPEKARGGEIILRTRTQRLIFIGGLAAAAVLALVLSLVV